MAEGPYRDILSISQYDIDPDRPLARGVLFLNKIFYHEDFTNRRGAEQDEHLIVKPLEQRGVRFEVHKNLSADGIKEIIRQLSDDDTEHFSAFVFAMSSHGERDFLYGSDGNAIHIQTEIMLPFGRCRALKNKPKIYLLQGCQSLPRRDTAPITHQDLLPPGTRPAHFEDTCVALPQPPGFDAFRSKSKGSVLLSLFKKVLTEYGEQRDIVQIFTKVNKEAIAMTRDQPHESVPQYILTLKERFFFRLEQSMMEVSLVECPSPHYYLQAQDGKLDRVITVDDCSMKCDIYFRNEQSEWKSTNAFEIQFESDDDYDNIAMFPGDESSFLIQSTCAYAFSATLVKISNINGTILDKLLDYSSYYAPYYDKKDHELWLPDPFNNVIQRLNWNKFSEKLTPTKRWKAVKKPGRITSTANRLAVYDLSNYSVHFMNRLNNESIIRVKSADKKNWSTSFDLDSITERLFVCHKDKSISVFNRDGEPVVVCERTGSSADLRVQDVNMIQLINDPLLKNELQRDQDGKLFHVEVHESGLKCIYDGDLLLNRIHQSNSRQQTMKSLVFIEKTDSRKNTSFPFMRNSISFRFLEQLTNSQKSRSESLFERFQSSLKDKLNL